MKLIIIFVTMMAAILPVVAKDQEYEENRLNFLGGSYIIIGKHYKSKQAYQGTATISSTGKSLKITKHINKQTIIGTGNIERAIFADVDVLRMRWLEDKQKLESTCLFQGDLDNYARISCYVYPLKKDISKPGLEAWFIDNI